MSPLPLGVLGSARPSLLALQPMIHDIRATDHAGPTVPTLFDRVNGLSWNLSNGSAPALTAGATPGGKSALTISGAAFVRPGDTGQMFQGNESLAVDSSSQFNAGSPQYHPVNVAGTWGEWATNGFTSPEWWRVKLKVAKVATEYFIASGLGARAPRDWTFQGSHDGSTWDILDTRVGIPSQGGTTFTFSNSTAYSWYRLHFTAINGGDLLFVQQIMITNIDMVGAARTSVEHWMVLKSTLDGCGFPCEFSSGGDTRFPFTDGQLYTSWGSPVRYNYSTTMPVLNQWRVFRMTHVGGMIRHYLDNVIQPFSVVTIGPTWRRAPILGFGGNYGFVGQLAHSFAFSPALSTDEADALYAEVRALWF